MSRTVVGVDGRSVTLVEAPRLVEADPREPVADHSASAAGTLSFSLNTPIDRTVADRWGEMMLRSLQQLGGPGGWWWGQTEDEGRVDFFFMAARPPAMLALLAKMHGLTLDSVRQLVKEPLGRPCAGIRIGTKYGDAWVSEVLVESIGVNYIEGGPEGTQVLPQLGQRLGEAFGGPVVVREHTALSSSMSMHEVFDSAPLIRVGARLALTVDGETFAMSVGWLTWQLGERSLEAILAEGLADFGLLEHPEPLTSERPEGPRQSWAAESADASDIAARVVTVVAGPRVIPKAQEYNDSRVVIEAGGGTRDGVGSIEVADGETALVLSLEGSIIPPDDDDSTHSAGDVVAFVALGGRPLLEVVRGVLRSLRWREVGTNVTM